MRHLHFTQSLEPLYGGGLGSSSVALHRGMLAQGVQSTLCATYGDNAVNPAPCTREFKRTGPHFIYFAPEMFRRGGDLVESADILHGHGFYVGTNYFFGRQARCQNKALVYHAHGILEPYILRRSRWKKRLVHALFENQNFRQVRFWRALTQREEMQIKQCGIKAPVAVIPNGVDTNDFPKPAVPNEVIKTPLVPRLTKRRRRVVFLSRIHPKKGLDLLIPCWSRLGAIRKEWELVVAGPDEGGYLVEMRALTDSAGLLDEVHFTGTVSGLTRTALLHSADLFVLPSYSEGFSMAILEAMACRVPVLATRSCNFPEITQSGAGWECEASLEALAGTLRIALEASDSERKDRGARAWQLVEQRYAWPVIVKSLVDACAAYC